MNEKIQTAKKLPQLHLDERQLCDLELLLNGSFYPLTGYLTQKDYNSVLKEARLANGKVWPMPIILDVSEEIAHSFKSYEAITLCDAEGVPLAVLHIEDRWKPDKIKEAHAIFGTTSEEHPGVFYLFNRTGTHYIGGRVGLIELP